MSPVVAQGRACPLWLGRVKSATSGLHLLRRRAPGHRRRRHPGDAERQRQGHGPVSRTLRRYPGPGCARRHDVRRRRLARRARPHRPRQRHLGAVAALTVPNSTPSSGFGSTYANASYRSASSTTPALAIIDACCQAWIDLIAEPDRMRTLCAYPWINEGDFIGSLVLVHPGGAKLVHLTLCGTRCWGVVPVVHRRDPRCFV